MSSFIRPVAVALLSSVISMSLLAAESRPDYRTYRMGDDVAAIARQIGFPSPATTAPRMAGPVLELTWRAQHVRRGDTPSSDPVALLVFSFYDDQLFRIVIDYAADRTEGMTEADMVEVVSRIYGAPAKRTDPPSPVGLHPQRPEDTVVAQWADGELQVALLALRGQTAFRVIVASVPLEGLARRAGARDSPADRQESASIDAARRNAGVGSAEVGLEREERRRVNIAAFIP